MKSCAVLLVAVGLVCLFQPSEAWPLGEEHKPNANWLCQFLFNRNGGDATIDDADKTLFLAMELLKGSDNFQMLWTTVIIAVGKDGKFDGSDGIDFLNGIYTHGNDLETIFEVLFFSVLDTSHHGVGSVEQNEKELFVTGVATVSTNKWQLKLPAVFGGAANLATAFTLGQFQVYLNKSTIEPLVS